MEDPIKGEFVLYEFLDSDMWTHLDALLVKLGVQTLFLPARHFNHAILGKLLELELDSYTIFSLPNSIGFKDLLTHHNRMYMSILFIFIYNASYLR